MLRLRVRLWRLRLAHRSSAAAAAVAGSNPALAIACAWDQAGCAAPWKIRAAIGVTSARASA